MAKRLTDKVVADLFAKNVFKASELNQQTLLNDAHAYFDKIISSPLEVPAIKTLGDSLNNLIDFNNTLEVPGVGNTISDVVDLDGLINDVLNKLGEELKVSSTSPLSSSFTGTPNQDDASFMVTVDDHGPVNIRLHLSQNDASGTGITYTPTQVIAALNAELAAAGLSGLVVAELDSGNLVFKAASRQLAHCNNAASPRGQPGPRQRPAPHNRYV